MKKAIVSISTLFVLQSCCTVFGTGCGEKCTTPAARRCKGDKVQVCNSNKEWDSFVDCAKINAKCTEDATAPATCKLGGK
jgi:hypothetical protein